MVHIGVDLTCQVHRLTGKFTAVIAEQHLRHSSLRIDEITDQRAGQFAKRWDCFKPTTVDCGLRTLRRALSPAFEWGKLEGNRRSLW